MASSSVVKSGLRHNALKAGLVTWTVETQLVVPTQNGRCSSHPRGSDFNTEIAGRLVLENFLKDGMWLRFIQEACSNPPCGLFAHDREHVLFIGITLENVESFNEFLADHEDNNNNNDNNNKDDDDDDDDNNDDDNDDEKEVDPGGTMSMPAQILPAAVPAFATGLLPGCTSYLGRGTSTLCVQPRERPINADQDPMERLLWNLILELCLYGEPFSAGKRQVFLTRLDLRLWSQF
ncbi:hypothetical protein HZH66_001223 [Vespula vulgaris]|uniref:Uncharacterized protein n=1 Tax=Vespula vulgaris TaxID=7454 RepID=A0A834KSX3_VESVU|nr:hypothetical protein HZH66_001223 [Vespula vulgaris]